MSINTKWRVIKSSRSEYLTIWKVQRQTVAGKETGFFKFCNRGNQRYIGPLQANELLCYQLLKLVSLPAAKTEITTIKGITGVLSIAKRVPQLCTWEQAANRGVNLFERMINPDRLYKTFVFDIWICNIDRSGKNIIVYPKDGEYDFYLIDHELALIGAVRYEGKCWNAAYWDDIIQYTKGYRPALTKFIKDYSDLEPYIREVQNIPPELIHAVVNAIPTNLLTPSERRLMEKILLYRQRNLDSIADAYITQNSNAP